MATYYPLHHKTLVWSLSTLCLLSGICYSSLFKSAQFLKLNADYFGLNKLLCKPISMRVSRMNNQLQLVYSAVMPRTGAEHAITALNQHNSALFNLNTHKTTVNDNEWRLAAC